MKNNLNLSIILAGLIFAAIGCGKSQNPPQAGNMTKVNAQTSVTPISISAVDLTKEYRSNAPAADEKYKGHYLAVQGKIFQIRKDMPGMNVRLAGDGPSGLTVICVFEDTQKETVDKLTVGSEVTLLGWGDGMPAKIFVGMTKCLKN